MQVLDFSVVEKVTASKKRYKNKQVFIAKNRAHFGFTLVLSGELEIVFTDGKRYLAKEGELILQREGDCYRLEAFGETDAEYIVVSYSATPKDNLLILLGETRVFSLLRAKKIKDKIERLAIGSKKCGFLGQTLLRALVQEILCDLFNEMHPEYSEIEPNPLESAKYYIDEFYDRQVKITTVAEISGYSVSRFRSIFKKEYGVAPNEYLTMVRIERAKEMLHSKLFTIEEVAISCGFSNVYYFSKVFKAQTGITPGKFNK